MALVFQKPAKVCRIGTHPFHFAEHVNALRGLAGQAVSFNSTALCLR